ncbi:ATP-binding protein [Streptomyces sp. NBRC 110028]|uniref:ATP-binding protein n=1 Tax=Streptomyces sp. NBRC 110028 TaxID=1621260 RepID=UPI0006E1E206|nr:ATP-binding protein [Streptomyces sp. NBRC 110028]
MESDYESDDRPPRRPPAPSKDPYAYTLQNSRHATSAKVCRDFVAVVLGSVGQEALVEVATLCTSELATNAFLHAEGDCLTLRVVIEPPRFRVLVYDASAQLPAAARLPEGDRLHGRGLGLVAALADAWGTADADPVGMYAKAVWFELLAEPDTP